MRKPIASIVIIAALLFFSCDKKEKDLSDDIDILYDHIKENNQEELNTSIYIIDRCGTDDDLKETIIKLNNMQKRASRRIDSASSRQKFQLIFSGFVDSLKSVESYSRVLEEMAASVIENRTYKAASLEEARRLYKCKLVLMEEKFRDKILGQWCIPDCQ